MPLFIFPVLLIWVIGLLALGIVGANHYYSSGSVQGFWATYFYNLKTFFGLTDVAKRLFTQAITNWMAKAAQAVDANVGTSFHYIAREIRAAADTMVQFSAFAFTVAQAITGQVSWRQVSSALKQLRAQIRRAEHEAQAATRAAIRQEKTLVRSVAQGIYPRLRGLEHDVERTIPREIRNLREEVKTAEDRAIHTARWLRTHEKSLAATVFAGAVAWALGHLGLGWLRCHSNPFNNNKKACNLWGDLAKLLAAATLVVGELSLVELAREEQKVVGEAAGIVRGFWGV